MRLTAYTPPSRAPLARGSNRTGLGRRSALAVIGWLALAGGGPICAQPTPAAVAPNPNYQADLAAVAKLLPGQWYEVPNSRLDALDPCPSRNCVYSAVSGLQASMASWSGAAYDAVNGKFLVHGGGHNDYAGNEVYAFDTALMRWERLRNPSTNLVANVPWWPDGTPNSSHTYDLMEYVPSINALCVFGNGSMWSIGYGALSTACLDMGNYAWLQKTPPLQGSIGGKTAYDPVTQSVWRQGAGGDSFLHRYNAGQDSWQAYGNQFTDGWIAYYSTATIDPGRRLFITVGGGEVRAWDMTLNPSTSVLKPTTGDTQIVAVSNPGLEYDPVVDRVVAWHGGADVHVLNTATWTWTRVLPAAGNSVIPTAGQLYGTYGRFRYIPSMNAYIAVNAVTQNVYFYRLALPSPGGSFDDGFEVVSRLPTAGRGGK